MSGGKAFDFDDDADDDRPSRRGRRRDEDDDDYGLRRPADRYEDERDDYDDMPTRRRGGPGDGMGMASMIVGIVGIVGATVGGCCCGLFGAVPSLVLGIVAVVLGFIARNQGSRTGMTMAGLITGFAAIAVSLVWIAVVIVWLLAAPGFAPAGPGPGGGPGGRRF